MSKGRMWQSHECPKDECGEATNVQMTNARWANVAEQRENIKEVREV